MKPNVINKNNIQPTELVSGVYRKTLLFNDHLMLCYFTLKKNSEIPIHSHKEHQIGYVLSGKLKFLTDNGEFIVVKGDSYLFDSNERHGAKILDDSEVIDIFSPARNDYK
ncbi:MAG: cupin domain-containing protein [Promethearchaeota archaeon]